MSRFKVGDTIEYVSVSYGTVVLKIKEIAGNLYYYNGKEIWDTTKVDTSVLLEALTMERKSEEKYFSR